jgi:hypothetical protein
MGCIELSSVMSEQAPEMAVGQELVLTETETGIEEATAVEPVDAMDRFLQEVPRPPQLKRQFAFAFASDDIESLQNVMPRLVRQNVMPRLVEYRPGFLRCSNCDSNNCIFGECQTD